MKNPQLQDYKTTDYQTFANGNFDYESLFEEGDINQKPFEEIEIKIDHKYILLNSVFLLIIALLGFGFLSYNLLYKTTEYIEMTDLIFGFTMVILFVVLGYKFLSKKI